ncbi:hypothetical protein G1C94_1347 [Bifidobacterium sp. DSM 109963]|uniref:Uncharacterized protein n=1 Tax=Bifidobacterium panos TaxID=2675321 RepID=A0ABX1SZE4_9BIFI|nr:hypothetical protein [Bifidobacterium sp. DSM 109963]
MPADSPNSPAHSGLSARPRVSEEMPQTMPQTANSVLVFMVLVQ